MFEKSQFLPKIHKVLLDNVKIRKKDVNSLADSWIVEGSATSTADTITIASDVTLDAAIDIGNKLLEDGYWVKGEEPVNYVSQLVPPRTRGGNKF